MTDSQKLLADYARHGSEEAFRELVTRYVALVHSAAIRLVDGDTLLAQDVTQTVFINLAQSARKISGDAMLGGWLHRHTCFVASKTMRGERRRQSRERQAVEMNALHDSSENHLSQLKPMLDDAINELNADDRTAILLRFFEQRDFHAVGQAIGASENTARMRVNRALEKLELLLKNRGVVLPAAVLAKALTTNVVNAAPTGFAATISTVALTSAATSTTAISFLKIMTMTKLKIGVVSAIAVAGLTTSLLLQNQAGAKLRERDDLSRKQTDQIAQLETENQRLSKLAGNTSLAPDQLDELQKLRQEGAALRARTNDLATLREENRRLRSQTPPLDEAQAMEKAQAFKVAKISYNKQWLLAFFMYADENRGQFPSNFDQAERFAPGLTKSTDISTNDFEIVFHGKTSGLTNSSDVLMLREKQAMQLPNGRWTKIYGFADGHVEAHNETDGNFDEWEKQRMIAPAQP